VGAGYVASDFPIRRRYQAVFGLALRGGIPLTINGSGDYYGLKWAKFLIPVEMGEKSSFGKES